MDEEYIKIAKARFCYFFSKKEDCWEWKGAKNTQGYGNFRLNGTVVGAHRAAWFFEKGYFPANQVLHKCDNPACVRPSHLFEGTHAENMKDMASKRRGSGPKGEKARTAKLTAKKVKAIRSLYKNENISFKELGSMFGVSDRAISQIVNRQTWSHV